MKKILYFVPTFSNLSETFILREVAALDLSGKLGIHVLSLKEGKATLPDNLIYKVTYINVGIKDLLNGLWFILSRPVWVTKSFLKFNKESEDSFGRKLKNFFKGVVYTTKIALFDFDQMHIHFLSDISTIISVACYLIHKPFSISGHARDIFIEASSINFKVKNSKFVTVCNTKAYLKCIEKSGGKGRKNLVLAFHGVDAGRYEFHSRKFNSQSELKVLTDARFTEKKGLIPLSNSIVSLIKDYDFNIVFTIVGLAANEEQQKHMEEVKSIFKKAHLYNHLSIPGNGKGVQQDEVSEIYRNSELFIYAGVDVVSGDADGVPNGLIQAAYSGLPVITTQSGSIADLFNDKNSYIIKQNDVEDIIEKFNFMILDKSRNERAEKLHKDVSENFDLKKNINYLESLMLK